MNATKQIADILTACGCKPAVKGDGAGNDTVKVNAPPLKITTLFDSEFEEWEHVKRKGDEKK